MPPDPAKKKEDKPAAVSPAKKAASTAKPATDGNKSNRSVKSVKSKGRKKVVKKKKGTGTGGKVKAKSPKKSKDGKKKKGTGKSKSKDTGKSATATTSTMGTVSSPNQELSESLSDEGPPPPPAPAPKPYKAPVKKKVVKKAAATPTKSVMKPPPPPPPTIVPMVIPKNMTVSTTSSMPQTTVMEGPDGVPVVVPLSDKDAQGKPIKDGPTALNRAPLQDTVGCMQINERGLLYFSPEFMLERDADFNPQYPPACTVGLLTRILENASTFIPKSIKFPDPKPSELGYTKHMTGYVSLTFELGYCGFHEVMPAQLPPLCPPGATLGVIVKDMVNGMHFFVATDGRGVGPALQAAPPKPADDAPKPVEGTLLGAIVRGEFEIPKFEACMKKDGKEGVLGWITSSGTGVPLYSPERGAKADFPNPDGATAEQQAANAAEAKAKAATTTRTPNKYVGVAGGAAAAPSKPAAPAADATKGTTPAASTNPEAPAAAAVAPSDAVPSSFIVPVDANNNDKTASGYGAAPSDATPSSTGAPSHAGSAESTSGRGAVGGSSENCADNAEGNSAMGQPDGGGEDAGSAPGDGDEGGGGGASSMGAPPPTEEQQQPVRSAPIRDAASTYFNYY